LCAQALGRVLAGGSVVFLTVLADPLTTLVYGGRVKGSV